MSRKQKQRKMLSIKPKYWLLIGIALFVILKTYFLTQFHLIIWDEAVYLTMGKYLITGGSQGFWEILRPPVWPLILGIFQLIGKPVLLAEIFVNLVAITGATTLYLLLKKHVQKSIAVGTSIVFLFSDLWFVYSSLLLTGVISATLIILACYAYTKKRPVLAGLLAGLAFITRFPAGIVIGAIGLTYLYYACKEWKNKEWKEQSTTLIKYSIGVLGIILPWLLTNWIAWHNETSVWWHAAFRPLIFGSLNVFTTNNWLYNTTYTFYFTHFFIFLPITVFAIWGLFRLKKEQELFPLALTGILALAFFTYLQHNEWRFALLILPGIMILTALGLQNVSEMRFSRSKTVALFILITMFAGLLVGNLMHINKQRDNNPPPIMDVYTFLQQNPVEGIVIVNEPVAAWYTNNKIEPIYFEYLPKFNKVLTEEHDAVLFAPHSFPCRPEDEVCERQLVDVVDRLTRNEKLIYEQEVNGQHYYIFSNQEWFQGLQTEELRNKYGLGAAVTNSRHPYDKLPIAFIIEDFPSMNEERTALWEEEAYEGVLNIFDGIPATVAIIPTHIQEAALKRPWIINELHQYELAQNGYDHTSLLEADNQGEHISGGKRIIRELFGEETTVFIPPYYAANDITANILRITGFNTYISTSGDPTTIDINRLDQTTTLIKNWEIKSLKTPEEIREELDELKKYQDYALISVYYFMYDNETLPLLEETVQEANKHHLLTASQLGTWVQGMKESNLEVLGKEIYVNTTLKQGYTLLFFESGNYTLNTNNPVSIKNGGDETITVCLEACEELSPNQFFLKTSAMVIPPPESD